MRLIRSVIFAAAISAAFPALAQQAILQAGPNTAGHVPMYTGQGLTAPLVMDAGGAGGGGIGANISELGVTSRSPTGSYPSANSGTGPNASHFCLYDGPTNNTAGYHYFCLDPNAQGAGLITYGAAGSAAQLPLEFSINGAAPFSFGLGGLAQLGAANTFTAPNNFTGGLFINGNTFSTTSIYVPNVSASQQTTTCSTTAGSTLVSLGSPIDFANNQGIRCNHAGPSFTLGAPSSPSVANVGTTGSTSYSYVVASLDGAGGVGAAVTTVTTSSGASSLTASNFNRISWASPSSGVQPSGYAIFGRTSGSLTFLGVATHVLAYPNRMTWDDVGVAPPYTPDWMPTTAPNVALADALVATITSGAQTAVLTVSVAASQTINGAIADHADGAALQAAISSGIPFNLPAGTINVEGSLAMPSNAPVTMFGFGTGYPHDQSYFTDQTRGTVLNEVFATSAVLQWPVSYEYGTTIRDLTIEGNMLAQYDINAAQINTSFIENIFALDASNQNVAIGNGSSGSGENYISKIKIDNPQVSALGNLPDYGIISLSANNDFNAIKSANAKIASIAICGANDVWVGAHGYSYLAGPYPNQNSTYNILVGCTFNSVNYGYANAIVAPEADGATTANIQISSYSNMITSGVMQIPATGTPYGIQISSGEGANIIIGNSCIGNSYGSFSTANCIYQSGSGSSSFPNIIHDNVGASYTTTPAPVGWTPSFSFTGGTGTSATLTGNSYTVSGHTVCLSMSFSVSFTTAPSYVNFLLPITPYGATTLPVSDAQSHFTPFGNAFGTTSFGFPVTINSIQQILTGDSLTLSGCYIASN